MPDQHNVNIPALANQIAEDIPDIKENLEFHKDVFQNFCTTWSNTDASVIFPKKVKHVAKTAAYTVTAADVMIAVDASAGAVTITLEPAATAGAGRYVMIKCTDATNAVTIDGDGTETIDGSTTYTLDQTNKAVWLVSNGSNWEILAHYDPGSYLKKTGDTMTGVLNVTANSISIEGTYPHVKLRDTDIPDPNDYLWVLFQGEQFQVLYWDDSAAAWTTFLKLDATGIGTTYIADLAVTTAKINDNAVNGLKISQGVVSSGSQNVATNSTWTPARGVWQFVDITAYFSLEINIAGTWRRSNQSVVGICFMDGTNMRLHNGDVNALDVYYQTF